ncbi:MULTISPECIES: hypothetical protein [Arcobacteraceae]|uniref:hypothetical protein n=1 Tax=Arcobacteraceae TaxID=2808963 RepID=UPI00100BAE44|nr:hypothetical protein [Arcobacter sp. CECT 8989]RXK03800.1 hypothetical protein CRV02_00985 [Arcobacter sp. CECT 8989]
MSKYYAMVPTGYVEALQQKGKREKARAFLEYFLDMHSDSVNSVRFYKNSWNLSSSGTTHKWIKEFKLEIEKFFTYWSIKNESHYSSVSNKSEPKVNTSKSESEQQKQNQSTNNKDFQKTKGNTSKSESEQQLNKDSNSINNSNINAESEDSANENSSNKRNSYSANFEILWNRYDKKSSNKGRSQTIYKRRWKNTDIKILIEAIDKYKNSIDLTYQKDFDGFLNGLIDSYVPKRAWIKDKNSKEHRGWFYDNENLFISDEQNKLKIESSNVAAYIQEKRFGYIA